MLTYFRGACVVISRSTRVLCKIYSVRTMASWEQGLHVNITTRHTTEIARFCNIQKHRKKWHQRKQSIASLKIVGQTNHYGKDTNGIYNINPNKVKRNKKEHLLHSTQHRKITTMLSHVSKYKQHVTNYTVMTETPVHMLSVCIKAKGQGCLPCLSNRLYQF